MLFQILRYIGWDHVTLMVSANDPTSRRGADAFKTLAKVSSICIAETISFLDDVKEQISVEKVREIFLIQMFS